MIYLNSHYTGSPLNQGLLDAVDNGRVSRLLRFGEPPSIPSWDGWRHPKEGEVLRLYDILETESSRQPSRPGNTPDHLRGFRAPSWLLVGQSGMVEFLTHRPQAVVEQYAMDNAFMPPDYDELNTTNAVPPCGNPLGESATTDEGTTANADITLTLEASTEGHTTPDMPIDITVTGGEVPHPEGAAMDIVDEGDPARVDPRE